MSKADALETDLSPTLRAQLRAERNERIRTLSDEGLAGAEIARRLGLSPAGVHYVLHPPKRATGPKPAVVQMTDDEILLRYGPMIYDALVMFGTDPHHLADMCDAAYAGEQRRAARAESRAS